MNSLLEEVRIKVYERCLLQISNYREELESREYEACKFELNGSHVVCRKAKITPKKKGQFVTFWKRNELGTIEPFREDDQVDLFVVNTSFEDRFGQFVFQKSKLIQKGIISTQIKEGKRAFRVYPPWDEVTSSQAQKTQRWQLENFYEIGEETNCKRAVELYSVR